MITYNNLFCAVLWVIVLYINNIHLKSNKEAIKTMQAQLDHLAEDMESLIVKNRVLTERIKELKN